jgi:hypothetical protein
MGEALPKGVLDIRKGTLRLDFYSGARVVLEGPATLELISPDLARLDEGRLTADVPPPAEGFTILNGDLSVVDRGTQFGMSAAGTDNCTVHVFDGEVELQGKLPEATVAEVLYEGDAVSASVRASPPSSRQTAFRSRIRRACPRRRRGTPRPAGSAGGRNPNRCARLPACSLTSILRTGTPSTMSLPNRASGAHVDSNGSVIGCEKLSGRWDQKSALGFAKTSDRVRFRTEGGSPSITMMAWVRVDSLPLDHNSLLSMAPGEVGEVHWKLDRSGRLLLGLRAAPELEIRDDHAVVAVAGGDGAAADRREVAGGVEVVDAQDGKPPLIGVSPAGAGGGEGVREIADELAVDDVGGGRVEIAAEEGGGVGKDSVVCWRTCWTR